MSSDLWSHDEQLQALESLIIGDTEFEQLEAGLTDFNIFEAVGAVRQEMRHSDFLAFLLDPHQNHGLGDAFATRFLQRALQAAPRTDVRVSPIQLDVWNLEGAAVLREWQNIDLVLIAEGIHLAVIIENKIDSREHSQQLERYLAIIQRQYPDWMIIALFLTPDGDLPVNEHRYIPCTYKTVRSVCTELLHSRGGTMGAGVRILIEHYIQMLEHHIVSDSSIAKLCQAIYQKHKRALDLIYEHRPDRLDTLRHFLENLVREVPGLFLEDSSKSYIRFGSREWDSPALKVGEGWVRSRRMLLFEIENYADVVRVKLIVGPGPADVRSRLTSLAERSPVLNITGRRGTKWQTLYSRTLIAAKQAAELETEELQLRIRRYWEDFVIQDLPRINSELLSEEWLRQPIPSADFGHL